MQKTKQRLDDEGVDTGEYPLQPVLAIKGRGSASQITHRFARDQREPVDDGWGHRTNLQGGEGDGQEEASTPLRTSMQWEQAKSALSRHGSPDLPFHLGLNPYRGCEHDMWNSPFRSTTHSWYRGNARPPCCVLWCM